MLINAREVVRPRIRISNIQNYDNTSMNTTDHDNNRIHV